MKQSIRSLSWRTECCPQLLLKLCWSAAFIGSVFTAIQPAQKSTVGVSREVMAGRQLHVYSAYKDMQIFHFTVPPLSHEVIFTFTANDTEACDPRDAGIYVTPHSYPIVAAAGEEFPAELWIDRGVRVYTVSLRTDNKPVTLSVRSPVPGPWFVAGVVTEDSNRITQAGLVPSCQSYVRVEAEYQQKMDVNNILPSLVDQPQDFTNVTIDDEVYYRFYVGPYGFSATVSLSGCFAISELPGDRNSSSVNPNIAISDCPVVLELTPLALSHHSSNHSTVVNCSDELSWQHHPDNVEELAEWTAGRVHETYAVNPLSNATAEQLERMNTTDSSNNDTFAGEGDAFLSTTNGSQCGLISMVMEDAWHYVRISTVRGPVQLQLAVLLRVCDHCSSNRDFAPNEVSTPKLTLNISAANVTESTDAIVDGHDNGNDSSTSTVILEVLLQSISKNTKDLLSGEDGFRLVHDNSIQGDDAPLRNVQPRFVRSVDSGLLNEAMKEEITSNVTELSYSEENDTSLDLSTDEVTLAVNLLSSSSISVKAPCWNRHDLVRKTFSGNFVFEYDLAPDDNGSVPLMVNVSTQTPTLLTFALTPFLDLGGTVSVELALYPFLNTSQHQYRLSGCLSSGLPSRPQHSTSCRYGYSLHLNTSVGGGGRFISRAVLIPFPDPGPWYLAVAAGCYTASNSSNSSVSVPCASDEVTAIFSVSSSSCVHGKCGKYGSCYQYIYAGYIFSTCVCDAGYRGWTCNDGSEAIPDAVLLLATLLLTLSNLAFLPAVVLAVVRRHFTEALVYTFTMIFSTLYHACDQETYNWCLLRSSVLQFCDFYSGILAFWVTLIAMAEVPPAVYSLLHMAGAIMVALGVELDRTGLWVFVVPAASALLVMGTSWALHSKSRHSCYPPRRYWLCCLLPGALLATVGLVCYAFLETHDNYQYVHSVWHVTMAFSLLCLLPPNRKHVYGGSLLTHDISSKQSHAATTVYPEEVALLTMSEHPKQIDHYTTLWTLSESCKFSRNAPSINNNIMTERFSSASRQDYDEMFSERNYIHDIRKNVSKAFGKPFSSADEKLFDEVKHGILNSIELRHNLADVSDNRYDNHFLSHTLPAQSYTKKRQQFFSSCTYLPNSASNTLCMDNSKERFVGNSLSCYLDEEIYSYFNDFMKTPSYNLKKNIDSVQTLADHLSGASNLSLLSTLRNSSHTSTNSNLIEFDEMSILSSDVAGVFASSDSVVQQLAFKIANMTHQLRYRAIDRSVHFITGIVKKNEGAHCKLTEAAAQLYDSVTIDQPLHCSELVDLKYRLKASGLVSSPHDTIGSIQPRGNLTLGLPLLSPMPSNHPSPPVICSTYF